MLKSAERTVVDQYITGEIVKASRPDVRSDLFRYTLHPAGRKG